MPATNNKRINPTFIKKLHKEPNRKRTEIDELKNCAYAQFLCFNLNRLVKIQFTQNWHKQRHHTTIFNFLYKFGDIHARQ